MGSCLAIEAELLTRSPPTISLTLWCDSSTIFKRQTVPNADITAHVRRQTRENERRMWAVRLSLIVDAAQVSGVCLHGGRSLAQRQQFAPAMLISIPDGILTRLEKRGGRPVTDPSAGRRWSVRCY